MSELEANNFIEEEENSWDGLNIDWNYTFEYPTIEPRPYREPEPPECPYTEKTIDPDPFELDYGCLGEYAALEELKENFNKKITSYEKQYPVLFGIAKDLFDSFPQTTKYGVEIKTQWVPCFAGSTKHSKFPLPALTPQLLVKMFLGKSFSLGTWDAYVSGHSHKLNHIHLETDMEGVSLFLKRGKYEIKQQVEALNKLGITDIRAFKTSKGWHLIIPLPESLDLLVVSLLALIVHQTLRDLPYYKKYKVKVDKCNTDKVVMRIPGGVHSKDSRVIFWFDPYTLEKYPIDKQIELFRHGYKANGNPNQDFFIKWIPKINYWIEEQNYNPCFSLTHWIKYQFIQDCHVFDPLEIAKIEPTQLLKLDFNFESSRKSKLTKEEAQVIWDSYRPGHTYCLYFGGRLIEAAIVLFESEAYNKLIEQAESTPGTYEDVEERIGFVNHCFKNHKPTVKKITVKEMIEIKLNRKQKDVVSRIIKEHKFLYTSRQVKVLRKILNVMISDLDSRNRIHLSYQSISDSCHSDHRTIKELLDPLIPSVFTLSVSVVKGNHTVNVFTLNSNYVAC